MKISSIFLEISKSVSFIIGVCSFLIAPEAPAFHEPENVSTTETSVNVTVWPAPQNNGPIRYSKINKLNINRVFYDSIINEEQTKGKCRLIIMR